MASVQEDIECPFCGYEAAQESSESRGEMRGESILCDICGFYQFNPMEGNSKKAEFSEPSREMVDCARLLLNCLDDYIWDDYFHDNIVYAGSVPFYLKDGYYGIIKMLFFTKD